VFLVVCAYALGAIGCLSGDNSVPPPFDAGLPDISIPGVHADGAVEAQTTADANVDSATDAGTDANVEADAGKLDASVDAGRKVTGSLVSGGTVSASPNYKLIGSAGQGPGTNAVTSSPNYKLHGGVVGATQKP
jgi:hypothetical protein